jgi:hypothetical protein
MFHTSHSHQIQDALTGGVENIADCADMLLVGSACRIQLERLFYFTGTTEQGTSGEAEIAELLSSANASSNDVQTEPFKR